MDEVYFVLVIHNTEPLSSKTDDGKDAVWCAAATNAYEDAEMFQTMLLHTLSHGDRVIVVGADFGAGDGITDVKAVVQNEVN